jgi:hypothetical protein
MEETHKPITLPVSKLKELMNLGDTYVAPEIAEAFFLNRS